MNINPSTHFLKSATTRLALTYLGIIMLMSIGFSFVFYNTSSRQLGRQLPSVSIYSDDLVWPSEVKADVDDFLRNRVTEGRHELLIKLFMINLLVLAGGGGLSYILARRAMKPIKESVEAQSQFISDASHELRTPLTAVKISNEVALRKPGLRLQEAKQVIRQNTDDIVKLQAIAEGLLQLAKPEELNAEELAAIDIRKVVNQALAQVSVPAKAKRITIKHQALDAKVIASSQSLVRVIIILLDNAVKYSPAKTTVTVTGMSRGKYFHLEVRDQGVGIEAKDQPHIFERFYRADKSRSKGQQDGYGLGLSIAEKLMHQQSGEISVSSQPGKGSVFSLKLRLAKP